MDSSDFLPSELESQKLVIRSIANGFYLSADKASQASLLNYNKDGLKLTEIPSYKDLIQATERISNGRGKRQLQLALQKVATRAVSSQPVAREAPKVLVIVTDGGSVPAAGETWDGYREAAQLLQKGGARLLVTGLRTYGSSRLKSLLRKPSDAILSGSGFARLDMDNIIENICTGAGK